MSHTWPPTLIKAVQDIIDECRSGARAPISSLEDILEILFENQIARHEVVPHTLVFVHPATGVALASTPSTRPAMVLP